ncbi:MAG: EscU/YscU/HrcU family type III secretion system export apparatus switch protein [Spirochaetia bacterium]|nr:EscU/YscU/HrcU family type III secretion system export apparatus switch protein [Spirochaetia bacterium]
MSKVFAAVALAFDPARDAAPKIAASATGAFAASITEEARVHGIPVVRDPELLEVLALLPAGVEIPEALFVAVARIFAAVRALDRKTLYEKAQSIGTESRNDVRPAGLHRSVQRLGAGQAGDRRAGY